VRITNIKEKKMDNKKLELIKDLVDDLGWEYQGMTKGGREQYKKLCLTLGWEFEWNDEELG
jgi:hypothetical protein|tara:strand:+ start:1607 stop:1789 length:183 start_codon:yes stop_codon:yes gene_type:complete